MATASDSSFCLFDMPEWDHSAVASVLTTEVLDTDLSYNAIVYLNIDVAVAKAFQMNASVGDSATTITPATFLTTVADVSMNPYQDGIVQTISTGCVPQANLFKNSLTLKGATVPSLTVTGVTSDHINGDYLGFLGYSCFGNIQACNLFTQTTVSAYASEFPGYDASFNFMLQSTLEESDLDNDAHSSMCHKIYKQLVDNVPHRFDASYNELYKVPGVVDNLYYLPIQVGDAFQFILTIDADPAQPTFGAVNGASAVETRKYLINAIVGASVPGTPQANPENGTPAAV